MISAAAIAVIAIIVTVSSSAIKGAPFFAVKSILSTAGTGNLALDSASNISREETLAAQGIAVVPSTGSVENDVKAKKEIQNSFSDQVEIKTDTSGTAGVITPVFTKSKGKDFMYVLVPVKEKKDAAAQ
jgi:hypothetical protein